VRAASVEIAGVEALDVYADGEPAARLPARLDVVPGALRVLAPASAPRAPSAAQGPAMARGA
jgi:diacylglycerol kinase family enzyme